MNLDFADGVNLEPDDGVVGALRVHRKLKMVLTDVGYSLHEQDRRVPE